MTVQIFIVVKVCSLSKKGDKDQKTIYQVPNLTQDTTKFIIQRSSATASEDLHVAS